MKPRDGYYQDLLLSWLLRGWLFAGLMAILALISACSPFPKATDILPPLGGLSASSDPLGRGEGDQTRNQQPQRGCDEKSDSSLRKPLL